MLYNAKMTKWFDTNYHYIVPEFTKNQNFSLFSEKLSTNIKKQKIAGFKQTCNHRPVSYLLLGKEKQEGFHRELINKLLPIYFEILKPGMKRRIHYMKRRKRTKTPT
jgi:5-methyltetrahydropteroyltriglutamate--homocysteine methyltransferase